MCCCATSPPARWTTQTGKLVLEVIARINAELGTTAVVITHNAAIAAMADRVVYLVRRRIQRDRAQRAPALAFGAVVVRQKNTHARPCAGSAGALGCPAA
jgi:ABC-type lipoprotein export system ATPase subunit